jgi:hypothetical protein
MTTTPPHTHIGTVEIIIYKMKFVSHLGGDFTKGDGTGGRLS